MRGRGRQRVRKMKSREVKADVVKKLESQWTVEREVARHLVGDMRRKR